VYWKAADGTGEAERLTKGNVQSLPDSWSPDGRLLALWAFPSSADSGVWLLAMDGPREARPLLDTPTHYEWGANISPDGRWLAYTSDSSGRYEVHVQPFPSGGRDWTISTGGGAEPIWSPRGDELFYRTVDRWMAVPVSLGGQFSANRPRVLFRGPFAQVPGRSYDVAPDARRFLVLRRVAGGQRSPQPQLILNWFTELRQKMAEGGK
jgi:serine/threonine-protein kinase